MSKPKAVDVIKSWLMCQDPNCDKAKLANTIAIHLKKEGLLKDDK